MSKIQEFDDLRFMYGSHRTMTESFSKKLIYKSYAVTKLGEIEINKWMSLIEKLIEKYNETDIQKRLYNYVSERPWLKNVKEKEIKLEALILHSMRIFENESWVHYKEFNKINMFKLFKYPNAIKINRKEALEC